MSEVPCLFPVFLTFYILSFIPNESHSVGTVTTSHLGPGDSMISTSILNFRIYGLNFIYDVCSPAWSLFTYMGSWQAISRGEGRAQT